MVADSSVDMLQTDFTNRDNLATAMQLLPIAGYAKHFTFFDPPRFGPYIGRSRRQPARRAQKLTPEAEGLGLLIRDV